MTIRYGYSDAKEFGEYLWDHEMKLDFIYKTRAFWANKANTRTAEWDYETKTGYIFVTQ